MAIQIFQAMAEPRDNILFSVSIEMVAAEFLMGLVYGQAT